MIDWHCHILPGMDDGSRDTDESLGLIRMLKEQEVDTVIATPHFFANDESADGFIERRQKAYDNLKSVLGDGEIDIVPGAEVRYYPGISKLTELTKLCIGNGNLLLLEMPHERWTEYTVKEVCDIANSRSVKLILAHIERYLPLQEKGIFESLYDASILMQVNAGFFLEFVTRRKALSYLQDGGIHFIGSDAHSIKHRPPRIGEAYAAIRKKFGDEFVTYLDEYGKSLLGRNKN